MAGRPAGRVIDTLKSITDAGMLNPTTGVGENLTALICRSQDKLNAAEIDKCVIVETPGKNL